jgi:hypothetical protein
LKTCEIINISNGKQKMWNLIVGCNKCKRDAATSLLDGMSMHPNIGDAPKFRRLMVLKMKELGVSTAHPLAIYNFVMEKYHPKNASLVRALLCGPPYCSLCKIQSFTAICPACMPLHTLRV